MRKPEPVAIDLFSGAGGLSLGLRNAGFDVRLAVDNDAAAVRTYRHNLGDHIIEGSIRDITARQLLSKAALRVGECDLLAGGPPCQGFSVQRRGPDKDERNSLVLEFLRIVEGIRPRFFLMENVPGLLSKRGQDFFRQVNSRVGELGYVTTVGKLDAVEFGVPQFRQRVFLIGQLASTGMASFKFPAPELDSTKWRTVRDAIGTLPAPPPDGSPHPTIPNHYGEAKLSKVNIERLKHIPPGGGREHLPAHLQLPCHVNNPSHRHLDVYGRLAWDEPSGTITARFDSFSRGKFAHPEQHRSITLREGARLQTFPDDFVFFGNREEGARQIGNAVPPRLAECVAKSILAVLQVERRESRPRSAPQRSLRLRSEMRSPE